MNEDVECLKNRVRDLDQYFRKTNIEISGILVMAKEDINSLTKDIGAVIGQKIEEVQAMAAQGVRATNSRRDPSLVLQGEENNRHQPGQPNVPEKTSLHQRVSQTVST